MLICDILTLKGVGNMFEEERRISILNKIQANGSTNVSTLAKRYQVSESTIRRDLTALENTGLIKRTHGGAMILDAMKIDYNYNAKRGINISQKLKIAQAAAALVKPDSTIFLGTSTITSLMVQNLHVKNLTVATNSLDVINVLSQRQECNLIILGGNYIHHARTIEGMSGLQQIQQIHFQQAFLGANGIDVSFGLSTVSDIEANSKRAIIKNSSEVYFLCEHSKFDKISQYKIADMGRITALITDSNISEEMYSEYQKHCHIIRN
jgi:DeoR/GlpR family transcriptional regulator of sugar metabolism